MALRSALLCRATVSSSLSPRLLPSIFPSPVPSFPSPPCLSFQPRCLSSLSSSSTSLASDAPPSASLTPDSSPDLHSLDIRVGRIVKAWKHPEADSLYVEEVDLGEPDGPRTICSGLVKYCPEDDLQGRAVLVLANLKPRNMRGVKSNGMLLAASDASHENVELLIPSEGSLPGERAWFGSESDRDSQANAATPNQVQKKKIWEAVQPHLKTTEDCIATFKGQPMRTSAGLVTCKSLKNASIA